MYQPLTESEIRLFILEPGSGTEPLRGRLVNVALSEALRYEALSYCWGTLADAEPILVNDIPVVVTDKHQVRTTPVETPRPFSNSMD